MREVHSHVPDRGGAPRQRGLAREHPVPELLRRPPQRHEREQPGPRPRGLLLPVPAEEGPRGRPLLLRRTAGRPRLGAVRGSADAHGEVLGVHHGLVGPDALEGSRHADARAGADVGTLPVLFPRVPPPQRDRRRGPAVDGEAAPGAERFRELLRDRRLPGGARPDPGPEDPNAPGVLPLDPLPGPDRAARHPSPARARRPGPLADGERRLSLFGQPPDGVPAVARTPHPQDRRVRLPRVLRGRVLPLHGATLRRLPVAEQCEPEEGILRGPRAREFGRIGHPREQRAPAREPRVRRTPPAAPGDPLLPDEVGPGSRLRRPGARAEAPAGAGLRRARRDGDPGTGDRGARAGDGRDARRQPAPS